jgi:hypothetical protein
MKTMGNRKRIFLDNVLIKTRPLNVKYRTCNMKNDNTELETLKRIPIQTLAKNYGWYVSTKESKNNYMVLRRGDEKVVANIEGPHHFWTNNHGASGSSIDFVMHEERCNLGQARKIMRNLGSFSIANTHQVVVKDSSFLPPSTDNSNPINKFDETLLVPATEYVSNYLKSRGLAESTINQMLSQGCIKAYKQSGYFNAALVHRDPDGEIVGAEIRNKGWKAFCGSKAGFFQIKLGSEFKCLAVTESAIDAMSFAELNPEFEGLIISTAGTLAHKQIAAFEKLINRHIKLHVYLGQDADIAGNHQAGVLQRIVESTGLMVARLKPKIGKDWNEQLVNVKQQTILKAKEYEYEQ